MTKECAAIIDEIDYRIASGEGTDVERADNLLALSDFIRDMSVACRYGTILADLDVFDAVDAVSLVNRRS